MKGKVGNVWNNTLLITNEVKTTVSHLFRFVLYVSVLSPIVFVLVSDNFAINFDQVVTAYFSQISSD